MSFSHLNHRLRRALPHGALVLFSSLAQAQGQPEQVVVTGSRAAVPLNRLVADVVVIDAQRIRDSAAASIEELLQREGGLQMSRNGGPGQSAGIWLRGSSASNTVVLVDGVRVGSASLGQADLAGLSLAQVERIEVLRGPGSSLYGADAVGGVVQIFTRRAEKRAQVRAHAALGGLASSEADASFSGANDTWDHVFSFARERSRGVSALLPSDVFDRYNPDADGFNRHSLQARVGFTPQPGQRFGLAYSGSRNRSQYDSAEYPPPSFSADASPDFRSRYDTAQWTLQHSAQFASNWHSDAQLSSQQDKTWLGAHSNFSRYDTRRQQFSWVNALDLADGQQAVLALERVLEDVDSSDYSAPRRRNHALVLGYTGRFGAHKLQADVRHDRNSAYGAVSTGKLGWGLALGGGWQLRAVAGSAFRAPTFNDLYYPGYGVAGVKPERARSVEASIAFEAATLQATLTLYRNRVRDLIGYQPTVAQCPAGYSFGCAANINQARLQGATLSLSQAFGALQLRGNFDLLDAKDLLTGQRLVRRAAHQERIEADWQHGPWALGATLLSVGARPESGQTLPADVTLDLRARWRLSPQWRAEASVRNAGNRVTQSALAYQGTPRQAWLGLRYDMGGAL